MLFCMQKIYVFSNENAIYALEKVNREIFEIFVYFNKDIVIIIKNL